MSTDQLPTAPSPHPTAPGRVALRLDRVAVGLIVVVVGVGWLLDNAGVDVPWRLAPAAGLVLVGLALVATVFVRGGGRGGLIGLGAVLLCVSVVAGLDSSRFVGPVGDRVVAPTLADWPVQTQMTAGTLTVDLTQSPLPSSGRLEATVGVGEVVVLIEPEVPVRIVADVGAGEVRVDGEPVDNGIDVEWSTPDGNDAGVVVVVEVGAGNVEVRHD